MDRYDVILDNEGVRIPSTYVVWVRYEKAIDSARKWVRVLRRDGTELILPIQTWDDVSVDEISPQYFAISVKIDWNGII